MNLVLKIRVLLFCTLSVLLIAANTPQNGSYKGCPDEGDGGDRTLNTLKNRSQTPMRPLLKTVADILNLPSSSQVGLSNPRSKWSEDNLQLVKPYESTSVVIEGFLRRVKQEGKEHCNCERTDLNDFHMWIISNESDPPSKSMVVEATPRWRGSNPNWNLGNLGHIVSQHARIRVTGWLTFDQEHPDQLQPTANHPIIRGTLWEIHPVTKIEVYTNGNWVEL